MSFRLHKWYMDCTTPEGRAVILYFAQLRLGPLDLAYSAVLRDDAPPRQVWSGNPPSHHRGGIAWESKVLGARGVWGNVSPLKPVDLSRGPEGRIGWRCHQASGAARVRLPDGETLEGNGYVEEVRMTVPPWRLPFRELRWGRFSAHDGSAPMIWIDWRGGIRRRWVFLGGGRVRTDLLEDREVQGRSMRLHLHDPRELRSDSLADSILGRLSLLATLLPNKLGASHETKWISRGELHRPGHKIVTGWAIHEVVRWG